VKVADSNLVNEIEDIYILQTGIFYFCSDYVISEINEGVNFDWDFAQEVIELVYSHYGTDVEISYISNRVNSYSLVPQDWLKFFNARHSMRCFAVVTYSQAGLMNVMMEKLFFKSKMKKFETLYKATDWVKENAPVLYRKLSS
jgi:hypothetical protein